MRDKSRIAPTLAAIHFIWERYPDLRLGQLITNLADDTPAFYIEDEQLMERITDILEHGWVPVDRTTKIIETPPTTLPDFLE